MNEIHKKGEKNYLASLKKYYNMKLTKSPFHFYLKKHCNQNKKNALHDIFLLLLRTYQLFKLNKKIGNIWKLERNNLMPENKEKQHFLF